MSLYNQEAFQKREGSRASVFSHEEKPLMTPLPQVSYEISTWVYGRKVQRNAHVVWDKNFYSAPISHIGTSVDLRITATDLQIYAGQQRTSSHVLPAHGTVNQYSTNPGDIPTGITISHGIPNVSVIGHSGLAPQRQRLSIASLNQSLLMNKDLMQR